MNRDDYIKRMETLLSHPTKFQKSLVPNKDYNFMLKEKRLVDNILDTLYENMPLLVILKQYSFLMDQVLYVYITYQKFIKRYLMVFQIIDQLYLKLALQYKKTQNIY